jgi:hypothetical protein
MRARFCIPTSEKHLLNVVLLNVVRGDRRRSRYVAGVYNVVAGEERVYPATRLHGASVAKAKRVLGGTPRRLEWLQG